MSWEDAQKQLALQHNASAQETKEEAGTSPDDNHRGSTQPKPPERELDGNSNSPAKRDDGSGFYRARLPDAQGTVHVLLALRATPGLGSPSFRIVRPGTGRARNPLSLKVLIRLGDYYY